jgi:hypothetical protein
MSEISAIAENLIISLIRQKIVPRRSVADWAFLILAIVLASNGILMLVLALDHFLEKRITPDLAALATGALVIILSTVIGTVAWKRSKRDIQKIPAELERNVRVFVRAFGNTLEEPIRENPKMMVMLAALAGSFAATAIKK